MGKWAVTYLATASHTIVVKAEDRGSAIEAADEIFDPPSLCHHCSRKMDLCDWEPDEKSEWGVTEEAES